MSLVRTCKLEFGVSRGRDGLAESIKCFKRSHVMAAPYVYPKPFCAPAGCLASPILTMASKLTLAVLCTFALIGGSWTSRLPNSCTGPEDCLPGECCVIGMQRYSTPRCEKVGQIGDTCRPYNPPENRTVWYGPRLQQQNRNTYVLFCPCANGLQCTAAQCQPATPHDNVGNDLVGVYNEYQ